MFFSTIVLAKEHPEKHDHSHHNDEAHTTEQKPDQILTTSCSQRADVKVNGLVCDFCAQAVEKVFRRRSEVADIDVDLETTQITIEFKKDKTLSDELLSKMILDSGYNVVEIKRGC